MAKKLTSVRSAIINAANELYYQNGYEETSFTQIAERAGISRGNFYHHFKSKDEILHAIIDFRLEDVSQTLKDWSETITKPDQRIKRYIQILREEEESAIRYGCPMGTLNTELGKSHADLQPHARMIFELFKAFLTDQFIELGINKVLAEQHAMHLLARSQGITVVAHAYKDAEFLRREADVLDAWLDQLLNQ